MNRQNIQSKIITAAFCASLFCFFAISLFWPKRVFSESENRYLQKKPTFTWDTLRSGKFAKQYEAYLSDQFPLRDKWIRLKVEAERAQGKQEIKRVYLGKEDYLIEAIYEEELDMDLYQKNLERLKTFAASQAKALGSNHMRVMLIPSSSQILKDKLPSFAEPFSQNRVYDDFTQTDPSFVPLLIPAADLLENTYKENPAEPLYYRTDHHWTTRGAYTGYLAWKQSLPQKRAKTPPDIKGTATPAGFKIETATDQFYGTIHSKLNLPLRPDTIELYLPEPTPEYEVYYDGDSEPVRSLYSMNALNTKDKYRIFLDGNHGWTKIVNRDLLRTWGASDGPRRPERLLIIKDSYAHCFAPFAAQEFGEIHMIDLRYYNGKISDFIQDQEITDILVLYSIPGFMKDPNIYKITR